MLYFQRDNCEGFNQCLSYGANEVSWFAARRDCQEKGGDLLHIKDQKDAYFFIAQLYILLREVNAKVSYPIWIGLSFINPKWEGISNFYIKI